MIHVKSPGRICLFGDHQDYLGLPVIACAIDRYIHLTAKKNNTDSFHITFSDLNTKRKISIHQDFINYNPKDQFIAALKVLSTYGCIPDKGYDISIKGSIPLNAGLSSSSALLLAWINFLIQAFGTETSLNNQLLAKIAFETEVVEQNGPGGKMDQYTISLGNIIYLETDATSHHQQIGQHIKGLVIGESGIAKDTLGLLNDRRHLALEALSFLKQQDHTFDVKKVTRAMIPSYLDELPMHLKPFFSAAINNHLITQEALKGFKKSHIDLKYLGRLMNDHHSILKNDLKITVPRIDDMIDTAINAGAYGAKIVGSGGGGCIVALAPDSEEEVIENILKAGAVNAYQVSVSEGISTNKKYA